MVGVDGRVDEAEAEPDVVEVEVEEDLEERDPPKKLERLALNPLPVPLLVVVVFVAVAGLLCVLCWLGTGAAEGVEGVVGVLGVVLPDPSASTPGRGVGIGLGTNPVFSRLSAGRELCSSLTSIPVSRNEATRAAVSMCVER